MKARVTFLEILCGLVLMIIPVVALALFLLTPTRSSALDVHTGDVVVSDVAATAVNEVVTLQNWNYTGHETGHFCPPGLQKKGPGHPGFDKHCSPFEGDPNYEFPGKGGD